MSYSRWSRGYWKWKPDNVPESLREFWPEGLFVRKSDVYTYEAEDGYQLRISDRRVEKDAGYDTPWELAERLIDLQNKGYAVPDHAIAALVEEQTELDKFIVEYGEDEVVIRLLSV